MKVEFVLLVHATFNMQTQDWCSGSFNHYPTEEEIKSCMEKFIEEKQKLNTPVTIWCTRVEKRYVLN
jgi:hypothetical protein